MGEGERIEGKKVKLISKKIRKDKKIKGKNENCGGKLDKNVKKKKEKRKKMHFFDEMVKDEEG